MERVSVVLVVLFGSAAWLGTNSVWMQLPLLTAVLPEGWGLPSFLAMVVQIACVGPLVYGVLHKCCCHLSSAALIITVLTLACLCQAILALAWHATADIFGGQYSLWLYVLLFGLALVNATSNVLFMPFMAQYHPSLLNAYFGGMGLSSLVPSLLSLVQGTSNYECVAGVSNDNLTSPQATPVYSPPRFGVSTYFGLIAAWTVLATVSFVVLTRKTEEQTRKEKQEEEFDGDVKKDAPTESSPLNNRVGEASGESDECGRSREREVVRVTRAGRFVMLFLTALVNAQMNGVIPSIHSYAALPYSQTVYHLGLTLSNILSPVASFLPLYYSIKSLPSLAALTALSSFTTAFIVFMALYSPGLLISQAIGGTLSVMSTVLAAGLHSYLRTLFASLLRETGGEKSENWLFWCGVFIQIGSFIGSAIMFPLVNFAGIFLSAPQCP